MGVDYNGEFLDAIFDVVSFADSINEVIHSPGEWMNWVCLALDTADLFPFVTGLGESAKLAKYADAAMTSGKVAKLSRDAISFAVSNERRLQHAYKHAADLGFGSWNSSNAKLWKQFITENLTYYTQTFSNELGGYAVTGYYRYYNGMDVAIYIYNEGPYKGLVATVVRLSENQMIKFGLK